jgi:hypothetical protein
VGAQLTILGDSGSASTNLRHVATLCRPAMRTSTSSDAHGVALRSRDLLWHRRMLRVSMAILAAKWKLPTPCPRHQSAIDVAGAQCLKVKPCVLHVIPAGEDRAYATHRLLFCDGGRALTWRAGEGRPARNRFRDALGWQGRKCEVPHVKWLEIYFKRVANSVAYDACRRAVHFTPLHSTGMANLLLSECLPCRGVAALFMCCCLMKQRSACWGCFNTQPQP